MHKGTPTPEASEHSSSDGEPANPGGLSGLPWADLIDEYGGAQRLCALSKLAINPHAARLNAALAEVRRRYAGLYAKKTAVAKGNAYQLEVNVPGERTGPRDFRVPRSRQRRKGTLAAFQTERRRLSEICCFPPRVLRSSAGRRPPSIPIELYSIAFRRAKTSLPGGGDTAS